MRLIRQSCVNSVAIPAVSLRLSNNRNACKKSFGIHWPTHQSFYAAKVVVPTCNAFHITQFLANGDPTREGLLRRLQLAFCLIAVAQLHFRITNPLFKTEGQGEVERLIQGLDPLVQVPAADLPCIIQQQRYTLLVSGGMLPQEIFQAVHLGLCWQILPKPKKACQRCNGAKTPHCNLWMNVNVTKNGYVEVLGLGGCLNSRIAELTGSAGSGH
ncbi:MAG: hypothetical protein U0176_18380 [Bacteroidia bacterium]